MMNLPSRARNYRRWPCELTEAQITAIRQRADELNTTYAAYTRALIDHSLSCPVFLAETSPDTSVHPNESEPQS